MGQFKTSLIISLTILLNFNNCLADNNQLRQFNEKYLNLTDTDTYHTLIHINKKNHIPSAARLNGEHYIKAGYRQIKIQSFSQNHVNKTALDVAKKLSTIDFASLSNWKNKKKLSRAFIKARDHHTIPWQFNGKTIYRTASWLYPHDGNSVRAENIQQSLNHFKYPEVKKLFVFGDLSAHTMNSTDGIVHWWYNVAVVVAINDEIYVIDPTVKSNQPITLNHWLEKISPNGTYSLKFSLCHRDTFSPINQCNTPRKISAQAMQSLNQAYLNVEFKNLAILKRNPFSELLVHSPYKKHK
ncbi:MAG: hypothetical protein HON94_05240 [Methylococcales bacterium]|jgi:sulfur carrier protein ThiS|nr:hypothetical protein [Methylococcales bacterium]MBT7410588.1 hypothetical protein [Methylococcales bacterium]